MNLEFSGRVRLVSAALPECGFDQALFPRGNGCVKGQP